MQKSISLSFEVLVKFEWLRVEYESYSISKNLIMSITMASTGWPIDTVEFRLADKDTWQTINDAMANNADTYWEDYKEAVCN